MLKRSIFLALVPDRRSRTQPYSDLLGLFGPSLKTQGDGTFADLLNGEYDAVLPIPYWDWIDRVGETAQILSANSSNKAVTFAWPLIKDMLAECDCLVSGTSLEIVPRLPPLSQFGTYDTAKHRVFMSATVSDDSFLIKGMGIDSAVVSSPLTISEKWSGEKMVLLPSLIDGALDRGEIVAKFAKPMKARRFGVVALIPSFKGSADWEKYGSILASTDNLAAQVKRLRDGDCEAPLVVANRYDGIDLPDNACRLLIFDGRPFGESLFDRHLERCIPNTEAVAVRVARTIEQGLGRSVRGEKDYSVILLVGSSLIRFVRMPDLRSYLSPQTRQQIEIGLELSELAQDDLQKGISPVEVLDSLIEQCLKRNADWKAFYVDRMDPITSPTARPRMLEVFESELKAEKAALERRYEDAANIAQAIADRHAGTESEKAWYLQSVARHLYRSNKVRSGEMQATAHKRNRLLLLPTNRVGSITQLPLAQKRIEKVIEWIRAFPDPKSLVVGVDTLLADLRFGVDAEGFESALHRLGVALGFACERPDKEWKEGPDNLWRLRDNRCLLMECKSEVKIERAEIEKRETEQMNRSAAWFEKHYAGVTVERVLIIPPKKLASAAALSQATSILQKRGLDLFVSNVRKFFGDFFTSDLQSLSERQVADSLERHKLGIDHLLGEYTSSPTHAGLPT